MKIKLIFLGKKKNNALNDLIINYFSRIQKEINSEIIFFSNYNKKKSSIINNDDVVFLVDEKGVHYDSISFSKKIKNQIQNSPKSIVFIVGDAYGFSPDLRKRSDEVISLSKLTFPHEIARLIIVEQLYRAITIIKNHPYHHE
jgi:23S rRNA (pseudouridine1915-N3)-methyltransferase